MADLTARVGCKWFLCFWFGWIGSIEAQVTRAEAPPSLVAITIGVEPFSLEPQEIVLEEGTSYLFVAENPHAVNALWFFDAFGQHVLTRYLQGAPSVSQTTLSLPSRTKVNWLLTPKECGTWTTYVQWSGQEVRSLPSKIVIRKPAAYEETIASDPKEKAKRKRYTPIPPKEKE